MNKPAVSCVLSAALLFGSPLAGADNLMRGTLDGKAHEWQIVMAEGHSSSYFSDQGAYIDVTLQGHAEQRFSTKGALSISMLSMGGQPPDEVEVMYFPEATMLPNFSSEGQDAELEISKFTINGDELHIAELAARVGNGSTQEVIIATNPTTEGEATAVYLARRLRREGLLITRIARGLPVGSDLELADCETLSRAFEGRREI